MYRLGGSAEDEVPGGVVQSVQGLWVSMASLPQSIYKLKKACSVEMEAEQQGKLLTPGGRGQDLPSGG